MKSKEKKQRGRPLKGESKRLCSSFTLPPEQIMWLEAEARTLKTAKSELLSHIISEFQYHRSGMSSLVRSRICISEKALAGFCQRYNIKKLLVYGSILTDRFTPESDIDILVEFQDKIVPSYFTIVRMQQEFSGLLEGRKIDLKTPSELSRYFRSDVIKNAEMLYAA